MSGYNPEMDFNNAESGGGTFDLIPDGTICKVRFGIRPGGVGEGGWLTQSKSSDALMVNAEFVVTEGPFAKRKFWENIVVSGGKVDEKGQSIAGNISRAKLRAILESARNVKPDDQSDEAKKKRLVSGYGDFNGMEFTCKVGVKEGDKKMDGGKYPDKNIIAAVITPDRAEYQGGGFTQQTAASAPPSGNAPQWAASVPPAAQQQASSAVPAWAR